MNKPAEILQPPPPTMRDKVGPRPPAFDADAIARAEAALKGLSENFQEWIAADIDKLDAARLNARAAHYSEQSLEDVFARAHDIKGLGTTYDYPLATAIAASLCRLTETPIARAAAACAPMLVDAHVDALRAVVRDRAQDPDHPTGNKLAAELAAHVDALVGPAAD